MNLEERNIEITDWINRLEKAKNSTDPRERYELIARIYNRINPFLMQEFNAARKEE